MANYIDNSKNNLFQNTALQNRLNGVSGQTMLGTFLVGNATQLLDFGTSVFNAISSNNDDSTGTVSTQDETCDIQKETEQHSKYNKAVTAFLKNPNRATATALQDAYNNIDNKKSSIINSYKMHESKIKQCLSNNNQSA